MGHQVARKCYLVPASDRPARSSFVTSHSTRCHIAASRVWHSAKAFRMLARTLESAPTPYKRVICFATSVSLLSLIDGT